MSTITQLEYLLALDKERNFARAAELCYVSQPSLSNAIKKMEEELGVQIFDRSRKPIVPTEVGEKLLEQTRVILNEHKKLEHLANSATNEPTGDFHLGVIPTLAPYSLPLFLGNFVARYPKVQLKVSELQTHQILQKLERDELDAGLLVTPLNIPKTQERVLFYEPFYAYVSRDHHLNDKELIRDEDLSFESLWLLEEGHCFRDQALKVCSMEQRSKSLSSIEFKCGNLETLKKLVQNNTGYTLLPHLATVDLTEEDKKQHLREFAVPVPTREVSLIVHQRFFKKSVLNALEKVIKEAIPPELTQPQRGVIRVVDL